MSPSIHVFRLRAVNSHNAMSIPEDIHVHAYLSITVHRQIVIPNAQLMPSVPATKLVSINIAVIHAPVHAEYQLYVMFIIIHQCVHASRAISEIHLHNVDQHLRHVRYFNKPPMEGQLFQLVKHLLFICNDSARRAKGSMQPITMWFQCKMLQRYLLVFARISRWSQLWMSARMCP